MKTIYLKSILALCMAFIMNVVSAQFVNPLTVVDASNPTSCDGSAVINNPNNVIQSSIIWYMNGNVFQQGTWSVTNLCPGTYMVFYYTTVDSVNATFLISGNPCNGFSIALSSTQATTPTSMDGAAVVTAVGGSSPYSYTWSNGATSSYISNLGVGWYSCCVTDATGCIVCDSVNVISSINPGNDTVLIINNNTIPNVLDSLGTQQVIDCNLDYNAVGGAYIIGSSYTPGGNPLFLDTIYLTWQVVDTLVPATILGTYSVGYVVYPPLASSYTASLQIYCPQKNTNYNTLLAIDQFYTSALIVSEMDNEIIYFTQLENALLLNLPKQLSGTISVHSLNGALINETSFLSTNLIEMNTKSWGNGMFIVRVSCSNGTSKLIKIVR